MSLLGQGLITKSQGLEVLFYRMFKVKVLSILNNQNPCALWGFFSFHYYKMWVQFTSPRSLDQWIHYFFIGPRSLQPVNSFKIQWNHLVYMDTFCCSVFSFQACETFWKSFCWLKSRPSWPILDMIGNSINA
jgi:hypothetical protein